MNEKHLFWLPAFDCSCVFTLEGGEPAIVELECMPRPTAIQREKLMGDFIDWESTKVINYAIENICKSNEYKAFCEKVDACV